MMHNAEHKFHAQGWTVSVVLHCLMASLAIVFMGQIKPLPMKEVFKWDVLLVQPVVQEAKAEPVKQPHPAPAPAPQPKSIPPVEPGPQVVTRQVQTIEQPVAVQRAVQHVVETAKPIEDAVKPVERTVAVQARDAVAAAQQETKRATVLERPVEQAVQTEAAQEVLRAAPVQSVMTSASVTASAQPVERVEAAMAVGSAPVVQSEPIRHVAPVVAHQPVVEAPPAPVAAALTSPAQPEAPPVSTAAPAIEPDAAPSPVVASVAPVQKSVKADHRWLAESLSRRLAELKRYPSAARLNGWEGRVVLRAVIRADGHLADVTVHKSSGHDALDRAAIDTIKLACPLHMKHALNSAEVAVYVPIVYTLAG